MLVPAVRKALKIQKEGKGYSFVEIVSACPTGWKMDPVAARDWLIDDMIKVLLWYDNEFGYSNRMVDLARYVAGN